MTKRIIKRFIQSVRDTCLIFVDEMENVFCDQGVLIFFILVPIGYPLLYSWLYTSEALKDVPTVFVDDSHSFLSRQFIRNCDANEGIKVYAIASNMNEAHEIQAKQKCHGIVYIPSDFERKVRRGEQTTVSFFADLSGMLYYKGIYAGLVDVSMSMGKDILVNKLGALSITKRDAELNTEPIKYDAVALFNPQGGYGSFLIPAVLMLIIQQTMLLGIGLSAGTAREKNKYRELVPVKRHYHGIYRIIIGKALCYFTVYAVMAPYITMAVPRLFHFIQLATPSTILAIVIPYILSCTFFGMTLSGLVRYRENVILLVLFTSVPFLFLSGVSWPSNMIEGFWKGMSVLFPSTFGINAFVKVNSFGASLADINFELVGIWIQMVAYFITAVGVYWYRINISRTHAMARFNMMRKRQIVKEVEK